MLVIDRKYSGNKPSFYDQSLEQAAGFVIGLVTYLSRFALLT